MGLKVGTVELEEYNTNWKNMFEEEKINLENLFGNVAIKIEHIGSTSVVGLCAKPIIDIAVAVKSLNDFNKVKHNFEKEPYSIKEDSVDDEILIRKGLQDNRTHFIHVMEIDSKRYKNTILFRDYLNTHKKALEDYKNLKIKLASIYSDNRKMYTSSKNDFIENIIKLAEENKDYIE